MASTSCGSPDADPMPDPYEYQQNSASRISVWVCGKPSPEPEPEYENRRLYASEVLGMWNLAKLSRELGTREQCISFAEEQGLCAKAKLCSRHKAPMRISLSANNTVGSFVCNRGRCRGTSRVTRAKGTIFDNVRLSLPQILYLMYAYSHKFNYDLTRHEDITRNINQSCLSSTTICEWFNHCREVVVLYQIDHQRDKGKIGGPNKVVQIDESQFGKRTYNKGSRIEGQWVLGLIEDGSEDLRLEVCPDNARSAEVLVPLIQKHVAPGTTIHTDFGQAYDCLSEYGYIHRKVDHSDPNNRFVAPDGTHTQRIQSQWRVVKRFFNIDNCFHSSNFADFVVEYLWRREVDRKKKDPFMALIDAIKHTYKV